MLAPTSATVRLFLHVLAATIWVGGQFTLAGLVPGARSLDARLPKTLAQRFALLAWPAFAVLVATGVWNLFAVHVGDTSTEYQVTVAIKLTAVALSGVGAALHSLSKTTRALAFWGAVSAIASLATVFLGVLLRTGS